LIGETDVRMQEGFCHDVRIRPLMGNRKVAVIDDADFLNEEGANCLLKTLEEPPNGTVILLIGSSEQRQLPTIRSRCQTVRVGPLSRQAAIRLIREVHGIDEEEAKIKEAVEVSGGDIHAAVRLLHGEAGRLRESLMSRLRAPSPDPIAIGKVFNEHLKDVGKEPMQRRAALRDLFSISVQYYRQQLRHEALEHRLQPLTLARLDRSVRALREVDRSANQATLIECFAADIASGETGDRGEIG
jgi:DNA polymerase-3 subunit delta'